MNTTGEILLFGGLSLGTLVASGLIAGWQLVRIPPDYFKRDERRGERRGPAWRRVLRNLAGALLVLVGLVLSIPGVPGQGLLLVLAGLMLVDLPGKYKLERRIISLKPIRAAANRLRAWRGRPPLQFPG